MRAKRIVARLLVGCWPLSAALGQPGTPAVQAETEARFLEAQRAMQERDFAKAESEFRNVLEAMPELAEARANLGLVLFLQGKYAETVDELERVASERPDIPATQLFLGLGYLKLGRASDAIPRLERTLRDDPANLEARRALAACHLAENDFASALGEYQAAHSHTEDPAEAWFVLGQDYLHLMSELGGRLVSGQPDSVWAARLGADMLGLSEAWEASLPYHEAALAQRPNLPGLRSGLGEALLRLGDLDGSERNFLAELRLDPVAERAWMGLADVNLARGDASAAYHAVAEVWESFPQGLAAWPGFPVRPVPSETARRLIGGLPESDGGPSLFLQAALLESAGEAGAADPLWSRFETELAAVPALPAGGAPAADLCRRRSYVACAQALGAKASLARSELLMLGRAFRALGRRDQAALAFAHAMRGAKDGAPEATYWAVKTLQQLSDDCFREVERLAPGSWRVHQLRAEAHRQREADDEAIAEYRRAIELNPNEAELHRSVGLVHFLNNAYDDAQAALARALELDGANPRTLYLVGRLRMARQMHAEAIPFLESALRLDPNLVEARPSLGRAYLRAGRAAEAAAELEMGLALDYYGDIHYSLFQAQRQLGNMEAAKAALDTSTAMRRRSFVRDRSKLDRWIKSE